MTGAGAEIAIRAESLTKRYVGVRSRVEAVVGVDMEVRRGTVYGLIGLNGAGKSTLIRMLVGLLPPTTGRCWLGGVDVGRDRVVAMDRVGYVPDRPCAYSWMRVREVVAFCKVMHGERWKDGLVADVLRRGRVPLDRKVSALSKGMAAKLSLGLALGHDPEVLILDEPTDGLDPLSRDDFLELVTESVCAGTDGGGDGGRTVLLSSHSLSDVERMADVVGLMHEGRLLVQSATEELVAGTKRIRAVLAEPAMVAPEGPPGTVWSRVEGREWTVTVRGFTREAVEQVRGAGVGGVGGVGGVRSAEVIDMSLDEVFKDIVRGREAGARDGEVRR